METLKKFGAMALCFIILVGAGCGIGNCIVNHNAFAGLCCIVLTIAAIPTISKLVKYLIK